MGTSFRGCNFVFQYDFQWFFISLSSLSKYHAYCFVGGKCQALFAAHASSLLVTPCRALAATFWFLVVMYIARSSAKSDPIKSSYCLLCLLNIVFVYAIKMHIFSWNYQGCLKNYFNIGFIIWPSIQLQKQYIIWNEINHLTKQKC